jgi:uncharacterized protein
MTETRFILVVGICIIAVLIAGCTQPSSPTVPVTTPGTSPATQTTPAVQPSMANPASVNCGKIGGSTDIRKNADGSEYGMCTFTNGTSCEEWALYRGEGCMTNVTVTSTSSAQTGIANPASVNCGKIGGSTDIRKNADGSEYGMCTFSNGTSCEEWALYRGEGCTTNVTAPAK